MSTEDDTFKALLQVSKDKAIDAYSVWYLDIVERGTWSLKKADAFLQPYGWKFQDLYLAHNGMPWSMGQSY